MKTGFHTIMMCHDLLLDFPVTYGIANVFADILKEIIILVYFEFGRQDSTKSSFPKMVGIFFLKLSQQIRGLQQ
jgi:hypothetical protein